MRVFKRNRKISGSFLRAGRMMFFLLSALPLFLQAQSQREVSGTIADGDNNPLEGVSVVIKNKTTGVSTDAKGQYRIQVGSGDVLVFSYAGFLSSEVSADGRTTVDVELMRDPSGLDEVVVMAYGTQKKATITGSIATVSGDLIKRAPANSLSNTLAGRLPGLVAINPNGEPGGDGSVLRVRGNNTLGNNSPLVVLDGIIINQPFDRIDQSDVETITVLKDASAAIYGAQAANGVILVTTKRGKKGKMKIDFTHNEGWIAPTVVPKMADAPTYATLMNELDMYRNRAPRYSAEDIRKYADGSDPWRFPNTDWYDEVYRKTASQRYDNLSIRGGSDNLNYFVSGGFKTQGAIYKNSPVDFSQYNFRSNVDAKLSEYVRLGLDLSGLQEDANYVGTSASDILFGILKSRPTMPAYWPNGLPGPDHEYGINPAVIPTGLTGYHKHRTSSLQANATLTVTVPWVKGLTLQSRAGHYTRFNTVKSWRQPWHLYYWDFQTMNADGEPNLIRTQVGLADARLQENFTRNNSLTLNTTIEYERNLNADHYIKMMVGSERITGQDATFWANRRYYLSNAIQELFAGGDLERDNSGSAAANARLNYFGRFNYAFRQKYLLELVGRYDGSFNFPEHSRFGFFPAVSAGWIISSEGFWERTLPAINYFKIRGSWGQTGNDRIAAYQFLSGYAYTTGVTAPYIFNIDEEHKVLYETRFPNVNATWEIANQANIGFDAQALNGKLSFSAEYFHNVRTDILVQRSASVPLSAGLVLPPENIGKVSNRGFEVQVGYSDGVKDFRYSVSANINYALNRIDFWDESPNVPDYQRSTGHPMGSNLFYNALGIFRDSTHLMSMPHWPGARPGDLIFEDVNKDGIINGLDRVRHFRSNMPRWTGGLNVSLEYKSVYLSFLLQGAAGAVQAHYVPSGDGWGNYLQADIEDRWTPTNPDASKPRAWSRIDEYWMTEGNPGINNTFFLRNSDYVRLKNLELGCALPRSFSSKIGANNIRVYFSGLNLLTFSGLTDSDPEADRFWSYPINKVYNLGINVTF